MVYFIILNYLSSNINWPNDCFMLCPFSFLAIPNGRSYAVVVYANALQDRSKILLDNNGKSGIYLWYNKITDKYYIGQSKDLGNKKSGRLNRYYHPSFLLSSHRGNSIIRNAILKYGIENFSWVILDYCPIDKLFEREQYWLDLWTPS